MDRLPITVKILGRPYHLNIDRSEEENMRNAAELINQKVNNYQKTFSYKDMQDLLAMVGLEVTSKMLRLEKNEHYRNSQLTKKLADIETLLNEQ